MNTVKCIQQSHTNIKKTESNLKKMKYGDNSVVIQFCVFHMYIIIVVIDINSS